MKGSKPRLSVVVASHNARSSVEDCLAALVGQRSKEGIDLIVVDNSTDGTTAVIRKRFPDLTLIERPPSELIPELWSAGIRQSQGDIVAITTTHFVPAMSWVEEILKAHETPAAAVGGAIENDQNAGLIDWAIYFSRYSKFMSPLSGGFVAEIAGDNASYKREYLNRHRHTWQDGFWEPAVHAAFRKNGAQLLITPSIVVCHKRSFGPLDFVIQRFQHGRRFGGWRASGLSRIKRVLFVALSPAIPFVLQFRMARQVVAKHRHLSRFVVSFPLIAMFTLSWTLGELTGYLFGPTK
jgi:glycosyltransferase involved in cell wall biosynthesis